LLVVRNFVHLRYENDNRNKKCIISEEFKEFFDSLDERTQNKLEDNISIIKTVYVLNTKFVKKIVNTDLYELRVSAGYNKYRSILFAIDH